MTQTYLSSLAITAPFVPRQASAAGRLRPNAVPGQVVLMRTVSVVGLLYRLIKCNVSRCDLTNTVNRLMVVYQENQTAIGADRSYRTLSRAKTDARTGICATKAPMAGKQSKVHVGTAAVAAAAGAR